MLTFWGAVTALTLYGGLPTVSGLWIFELRRARRRNRDGACATCGRPWRSEGSGDPYLIHGRLVCEPCAETAKRRMPWHIGALAVAAAVAGGGIAVAGGSSAMAVLFPIGTTLAMTAGAVQWMKAANRRAQRRIAAGEFPDLPGAMSNAPKEIGERGAAAPAG